MKKYLLSLLFCSIKLYAQQDLPYVEGEIDKASSKYSAVPPSSPNIPLYKPNYDNSKVNKYIDNLRKEENSVNPQGGSGTLEKIIEEGKNKIDIYEGYVKAKDGYTAKSDVKKELKNETYMTEISDKKNCKVASNKMSKKISHNVILKTSNSNVLETVAIIFLIIISLFFPVSRRR